MKRDGTAMVIVITAILFFSLLIISLWQLSISNFRLSDARNDHTRAFYLAEAGLQKALLLLKGDFLQSPSAPSWSDQYVYTGAGSIDLTQGGTVTVPRYYPDFYPLPNADGTTTSSLGDGYYSVSVSNVSGSSDEIYVRSTGYVESKVARDQNGDPLHISRTLEVKLRIQNASPWNLGIFAGSGASGSIIKGNAVIAGSLSILGDERFIDSNENGKYDAGEVYAEVIADGRFGEALTSSDLAIDMSGGALIANNYSGMSETLLRRVPSAPQTEFGNETVETLGAELRVKHGKAGLSGTGTAGRENVPGNGYKETLDGAYVTDGYGGNQGAGNVYSDNGTGNEYDEEDLLRFPSLKDAYTDPQTQTFYAAGTGFDPDQVAGYQRYLKDKGYVHEITEDLLFKPYDNKKIGGASENYIEVLDEDLYIDGLVYIEGSAGTTVTFGPKIGAGPPVRTLTYHGEGTVFFNRDIVITCNFLTPDAFESFPQNIMGFITPRSIRFEDNSCSVMGVFYAEEKIMASKQSEIAGTFFGNYVDMGTNVPSLFFVPATSGSLPPMMPKTKHKWFIKTLQWREVF